jgi:hypothetical protein
MKLRLLSLSAMLMAWIAVLASWSSEMSASTSASAAAPSIGTRTPDEFRRAADNTFLAFPEWYLVYSPREYANFIVDQPPSHFPYLGHLRQLWEGYAYVYRATRNSDSFNTEYHVMIWVIGISTTGEYGLKWLYETVVGRASESMFGYATAEDQLAATVARDYVELLDREPWFNFDFVGPLKRLWTQTPWWGAHPVRKLERRYFLTTEYLAKAAYAWLIKKSSEASYGVEKPITTVVLDRAPPRESQAKILSTFPDGAVLAQVPRYQAFADAALELSKEGISFLEIAGNAGPILITVIAPAQYEQAGVDKVFEQPIITEPGRKRIAFTVRVADLSQSLRQLNDGPLLLEHIYDY